MKHLRRYNESKEQITKELIIDFFSHTFDLCDGFEIEEAYFDFNNSRSWANNDFSGNHAKCEEGFEIKINHSFYNECEISDFNKYNDMTNQLLEDIKRFKETFNPKDIFFSDATNLNIAINP